MKQGFADRLRRAILSYESQIGHRVSYAALGEAIAKREGRANAYGASAISEWVNGRAEPGLDTLRAIALTLNVTTDSLVMDSDVPRAESPDVPRDDGEDGAAQQKPRGPIRPAPVSKFVNQGPRSRKRKAK